MSAQLEIIENGIVVGLTQTSIDVAIQQQTVEIGFEDGISVEIAVGAVVLVPGRGMPSGGIVGQFLGKNSDDPFDNSWQTVPYQAAADAAQAAAEAYTDTQIAALEHDGYTFVANIEAGMDIAAHMPVYVSRATNKLMLGDSSTYLASLIIGYTAAAVSNGFAVDVRRGILTLSDWSAVTGSTSLQAGSLYFLQNGGGMTLAPPSLPTDAASAVMGKAVSPTTFDFNPALPIQL